jgi:hypothetical protein
MSSSITYGDRCPATIEVRGLSAYPKCGLLIVGVVVGGSQRGKNVGPGKGATRLNPIASKVVRVSEIAQRRGPLLVRHGREFGARLLSSNKPATDFCQPLWNILQVNGVARVHKRFNRYSFFAHLDRCRIISINITIGD